MPYITQQDRKHIEYQLSELGTMGCMNDSGPEIWDIATILLNVPSGKVKGAFNYFVTRLFCQTFDVKNAGYTDLSNAIAVMGDMEHELRRRLLDKYEDVCIEKNGDLSEFSQ